MDVEQHDGDSSAKMRNKLQSAAVVSEAHLQRISALEGETGSIKRECGGVAESSGVGGKCAGLGGESVGESEFEVGDVSREHLLCGLGGNSSGVRCGAVPSPPRESEHEVGDVTREHLQCISALEIKLGTIEHSEMRDKCGGVGGKCGGVGEKSGGVGELSRSQTPTSVANTKVGKEGGERKTQLSEVTTLEVEELLLHELAKTEEAANKEEKEEAEEEAEEEEAKKSSGNSEKKEKEEAEAEAEAEEAEKFSKGSARSGASADTKRETKSSRCKARPNETAGACAEADQARKKRRQTNATPHRECSPALTQTDHDEEAKATFKIGEKVEAKYKGYRYYNAIITGFNHAHITGALRYMVAWDDETEDDLIKESNQIQRRKGVATSGEGDEACVMIDETPDDLIKKSKEIQRATRSKPVMHIVKEYHTALPTHTAHTHMNRKSGRHLKPVKRLSAEQQDSHSSHARQRACNNAKGASLSNSSGNDPESTHAQFPPTAVCVDQILPQAIGGGVRQGVRHKGGGGGGSWCAKGGVTSGEGNEACVVIDGSDEDVVVEHVQHVERVLVDDSDEHEELSIADASEEDDSVDAGHVNSDIGGGEGRGRGGTFLSSSCSSISSRTLLSARSVTGGLEGGRDGGEGGQPFGSNNLRKAFLHFQEVDAKRKRFNEEQLGLLDAFYMDTYLPVCQRGFKVEDHLYNQTADDVRKCEGGRYVCVSCNILF